METKPLTPQRASLAKKIIIGVIILVGVLIILFIAAIIFSIFDSSRVANYSGYGYASDSIGIAPSSGISKGISLISENATGRDYAAPAPTVPSSAGQPQTIQQKVIKNASLDITVDDVDQTVAKISNETNALSGFIQNSNVNETTTGKKTANLVLRIPVANFETLISRIKSMAKLVSRENINGVEVTQEYVDLQSALTHNQAVEAQYLELLKRAQKVEEIIAVRDKLDQVQGEIESLKGRISYLDNQTEMSTISVNITSEVKISLPADKWQPLVIVKESVKKLIVSIQNFVNFVIVLVFFLIALIPYLLLLLILFLLIKWLYKKYRKSPQI